MPWYELAIETEAARRILRSVTDDGFDFASSMDFEAGAVTARR
jgi:protocatechuate 4,5-dioxygenase beta chain